MAASCNRKVVTTAVAASVAAAAAKAAASDPAVKIVTEALLLKDSMKEANFQQFPLFPLSINVETKQVMELASKLSGEVIKGHTETHGSICYVVRRPGWPFCREEGLSLTELHNNETKPLEGFGLWGVMKETGVDDQGLCDFTGFYPYPLYKDDPINLNFYKALGNRKLSIPFNPFKMMGGMMSFFSSNSRVKEKKIEGNMVGEGMLKGGVIIFGKDGSPKYAYLEQIGSELPVEDILAAVHALKKEQS